MPGYPAAWEPPLLTFSYVAVNAVHGNYWASPDDDPSPPASAVL